MLRVVFRFFAYPLLSYILVIYYHAKSNDPDGFNSLKTAFNLPDTVFDTPPTPFQEETSKTSLIAEDTSTEGLEYPLPAPKAKSIKPVINDLCQDLLEQRQILYDLATSCKFLLSLQIGFPQPIKCYSDFPYYERPLNLKLLENAHVYTAHIESFIVKLDGITQILKSSVDLSALPNEILRTVKECGQSCLPLAEILYKQPELSETQINELSVEYTTRFDSIDKVLRSSLTQSQNNLLSSQYSAETSKQPTTQPDSNSSSVHKTALAQLNEHFPFLKDQKVITPDRIDQKSLKHFAEHATNINFDEKSSKK